MITDKSKYGHDAVLDLDCGDAVQVLRTEPMTLTDEEQAIVRAYLGIMLLNKSYINPNGHLILVMSDGREYDLGTARGLPGATPYIGKNGNWFVEGRDTLTPARGPQGFVPYVGENRNWFVNGEDTGVYAQGVDGDIPYIADDGNWHVGDTDTGIRAQGPQGIQGVQGPQGIQGVKGDTPYIGENGNWWIAGSDLKVAAQGPQGIQGIQGIQGPKGDTPQIGGNGNWTVGGTDTGVRAQGPKGDTGATGATGPTGPQGVQGVPGEIPHVGSNGNWWVGNTDTGVQAQGPKGETGEPGTPGIGLPSPETADNARYLRNDNTWQTIDPADIGAAAAKDIAKTSTLGLSNSAVSYVKIAGFGSWGTGAWYQKGFSMLLTSRGGETIWVSVSSDDSNTNAKAIRLMNTYSKMHAVYYSASESAIYVQVGAWCNNVNAHILSNVNGDYVPTVEQASGLPSDATAIGLTELGPTGSALNLGNTGLTLALTGSGDRPTFNGNELARVADVPSSTEALSITYEDGTTGTLEVYRK